MKSLLSPITPKFLLPLLIVSVLGWSPKAIAHRTELEYRKTQAVQVEVAYGSGQPMANAQVTVYAPENPTEPWQTGITDDQGQFSFVPDQSGRWEVKVRKAGHGNFLTVPVGEEETQATDTGQAATDESGWRSAGGDITTVDQVIYGAVGAWGFFGTALFFVRRRQGE